MLKHVIYGLFGFLGALSIAAAIYLDKPSGTVAETAAPTLEEEIVEGQVAAAETSTGTKPKIYEVIKVIDGDTISILKEGVSETIRLIGINAPETGQCYSGEASQKLKSLAGTSISIELDSSQGERDKYDRLLAYVFTESGINTAQALIEGGFAKEYTYNKPYKYQAEFKAAQSAAQSGGRGLWASGACVAPAPAYVPPPVVTPVIVPTTQTQPEVQKTAEPEKKKIIVEEEEEDEPEEKEEEPAEKEEEEPAPRSSGSYTCSTNTYNCDSFSSHAEAQAVYDACGGVSNDVHRLDSNKDGLACESLP